MTTTVGAPVAVERLRCLLDSVEDMHFADGVVVATGSVATVHVVAFATDPSVQGGALGIDSCRAIVEATDLALERGVPVVGLWHSGGARLREGAAGLHGVAGVFAAQTRASGRVPQISVVLGPAAGGAAYGPALTDVVVQAPAGKVFVTGPDVVRSVTGEDCDAERLGGSDTHRRSGVVHLSADDEPGALALGRRVVDLLGAQGSVDAGQADAAALASSLIDPGGLVPSDHRKSYDVRPVAAALLDEGSFLELQPGWARNAVIGFGRLAGRTVGVVANDPQYLAGCLDAATGDKTGRFVQLCDALGLPLLFLVDVPGYLPGVSQEDDGVIRRGAKLLHSFAACRVPRLTVVLRKSFGGAFIAMGSKGLGADRVLAWPGAQVDVMGATAAVGVLHRKKLAAQTDPARRAELLVSLVADHEATTGGLGRAVECGAVDAVIEPADTRRLLVEALAALPARRGSHANPPL